MQGSVDDKILADLCGKPVFSHVFSAFAHPACIGAIAIVYRDQTQKAQLAALLDASTTSKTLWVPGGEERQDSVLRGLEALPEDTALTLIHDCARPRITPDLIENLIATAREDGAAALAHPVTDTIKRIPEPGSLRTCTLEDLERNRLWAMETPQCFRHADILRAYRHVKAKGLRITDDCGAAASIGIGTTLVPNEAPNPKITTAADLSYLRWLLRQRPGEV